MKKIISGALLLACFNAAQAQHTEWRTGVRDTSYSTRSDYANNVKKYPFIKIVPDRPVPKVAEQRNLVYAQIGDRALHIDAFLPKNATHNTPAILIVHGGGWRSGDRSQHIPLAQHLAAKGIACFTVEYRLSTEAFYPGANNAQPQPIKSLIKLLLFMIFTLLPSLKLLPDCSARAKFSADQPTPARPFCVHPVH